MPDTITYPFIRGDDFKITMTLTDPQNADAPVDITNWVITSQVRYARKLVDDLVIVLDDPINGVFSISKPSANTQSWPVRELKCDIQFDRTGGTRISSNTFMIDVSEDQTQ